MKEIEGFLTQNYGLAPGMSIKRVEAGFLSENYKVEAGGKAFFLKCYRFDKAEKIQEIHRIKNFFASKGLPVILPIKTKGGSTYFSIGQRFFALFPFVAGIHFNRGSMPPRAIVALAELAANMHKAGAECNFSTMEKFGGKELSKFLAEAEQLMKIIEAIPEKTAFDRLALESLRLKVSLAKKDWRPVSEMSREKPILLQGDFHEQNVFFDESGKVKYIFDFEKAVTGYRSFELWRSADYAFLNGDFSDKRINDIILYFREYNSRNPISPDELSAGLDMYYQRLINSLWVEREHYVVKSTRTDHFLENRSVMYLSVNKREFIERVLKGVYH